MGVHNNFPAPSWIKLDGISVTKGEEVHIVSDFKTNLKYIYWSLDTPKQLTASNVMLNRSSSRFLIVVNNKGECILVPNEGITVSFDGNSVEAINEHIWGLYEKNEEYGDRFVSVEQNIEGITQTVGQTKEELGEVTEQVSKIEQKTESIDLSVKNLNREYNEDKETQELRENVNKSIIDINSAVGLFKSKITETFKDNEISENENTEIQAQINILEDRKIKVVDQVDKVIALIDTPENQLDTSRLTSQKQVFISAIGNLVTLVNNVISDKVIVPTDVAIITSAFGSASVEINTLKNIIDEIIFLGVGGTISEELARIGVKSDEIVLSVNKIEENNQNSIKEVDKKYSEILLAPDGIVNRVGKVETKTDSNSNRLTSAESEIRQLSNQISFTVTEGEVKSIIEQSPDEIRYGFNDISDYVVINRNGLTVNRGSIACNILTTPPGEDPIIKLFPNGEESCSIDATYQYETGGKGSSIRLKWDRGNYVRIGSGNCGIHLDGEQKFSFYSSSTADTIRTTKGEVSCTNSGLKYNGSLLSREGHTHTGDEVYYDRTQAMTVGNVTTGDYPSNGSYMGGYIRTSGVCRADGGFVDYRNTSSRTYTGKIETRATTSVTPNAEYIGEGVVKNGECVVEIPPVVCGMGMSYNIQITPIGNNPHIYVFEKNLTNFVVKGDDCKFDYIVKINLPKLPKRLRK